MGTKTTVNVGFITNSSSVINCFPREVLEDEKVQAFLRSYEVECGFVGDDLWNRSECGSFLVTKDQKRAANEDLGSSEFMDNPSPFENDNDDEVVVVFGDEYHDLAAELNDVISEACDRLGLGRCGGAYYN